MTSDVILFRQMLFGLLVLIFVRNGLFDPQVHCLAKCSSLCKLQFMECNIQDQIELICELKDDFVYFDT